MSERRMLNLQPAAIWRLWNGRGQDHLIGATQSVTVRVRYEKILPPALLLDDRLAGDRAPRTRWDSAPRRCARFARGARARLPTFWALRQTAAGDLITATWRPSKPRDGAANLQLPRRIILFVNEAAVSITTQTECSFAGRRTRQYLWGRQVLIPGAACRDPTELCSGYFSLIHDEGDGEAGAWRFGTCPAR